MLVELISLHHSLSKAPTSQGHQHLSCWGMFTLIPSQRIPPGICLLLCVGVGVCPPNSESAQSGEESQCRVCSSELHPNIVFQNKKKKNACLNLSVEKKLNVTILAACFSVGHCVKITIRRSYMNIFFFFFKV